MQTSWKWIALVAMGFIALACAGEDPAQEEKDTGAEPDIQEEEDISESECTIDSDCGELSDCLLSALCEEGICSTVRAEVGSVCEEGCLVGTCDEAGSCTDTFAKECPEQDGNLCLQG